MKKKITELYSVFMYIVLVVIFVGLALALSIFIPKTDTEGWRDRSMELYNEYKKMIQDDEFVEEFDNDGNLRGKLKQQMKLIKYSLDKNIPYDMYNSWIYFNTAVKILYLLIVFALIQGIRYITYDKNGRIERTNKDLIKDIVVNAVIYMITILLFYLLYFCVALIRYGGADYMTTIGIRDNMIYEVFMPAQAAVTFIKIFITGAIVSSLTMIIVHIVVNNTRRKY